MKKATPIFLFAGILIMVSAVAACTSGSNVERSAARSLENAGSVYRKYEPKVIGPGESPNPNANPSPYPTGDR